MLDAMDHSGRATRIRLTDVHSPPMRAFHLTWLAFFTCFFAWFGIAPLMHVVRDELGLTAEQVGWCGIASVAITIFARLAIGWCCDRVGPRIAYTWLLLVGSLPIMGIALAGDFWSFLLCRALIGAIGASFVITQYHTSLMFAPNCVGTANATTAGWGNVGGGAVQFAMPAMFALLVGAGMTSGASWRLCMVLIGLVCAGMGVGYFYLTQDTPRGNFRELRASGAAVARCGWGGFGEAVRDHRVWALGLLYGASFGVELTINNMAVLYFLDYFDYFRNQEPAAALQTAGIIASSFGLMNIFARTLGGWMGDKLGNAWGFGGRVKWLFLVIFCEGLALMAFSQAYTLLAAVPLLVVFSLFVQMSNGANFAVVPFVNPRALGAVSGMVGAGGNVGAIAAGLLFTTSALDWHTSLLMLGAAVTAVAFSSFAVSQVSAATADLTLGGSEMPELAAVQ
jgi:NNP family nitrate/nitrite transporter-like MFS transporter